ncbi:MAG: VWA domain-containing protein, partial [Candidatus Omnitrophota bacterium]
RKDDRIGLVIIAGESYTQCPRTVDHKAILTLLEKIQIGMVEDGTAIGLGLANAVNRLKNSPAKSKVIILLTDGINNAGEIDPQTASDLARQYGIRVYTIGVGKEGTAFLPVNDPRFGTRMLRVETQIDENMLKWISANTSGAYFRAQGSEALREIFGRIDKLEKTEVVIEKSVHYQEYYLWFLWPALVLVFYEMLWGSLIAVKIP